MIKIIGIGGEPASGKSSIVRHFYNEKFQKLIYSGQRIGSINRQSKIIILGIYDEFGFCGTDRLSFAVQPKIVKFIDYANSVKELDGYKILFEGDRLFNSSFIVANSNLDCKYILLTCSKDELERRHKDRKDNQDQTFLKGRKTKYYRLKSQFQLVELPNENYNDQQRIIKSIENELL
jgi:GTPase SAR1 family protein